MIFLDGSPFKGNFILGFRVKPNVCMQGDDVIVLESSIPKYNILKWTTICLFLFSMPMIAEGNWLNFTKNTLFYELDALTLLFILFCLIIKKRIVIDKQSRRATLEFIPLKIKEVYDFSSINSVLIDYYDRYYSFGNGSHGGTSRPYRWEYFDVILLCGKRKIYLNSFEAIDYDEYSRKRIKEEAAFFADKISNFMQKPVSDISAESVQRCQKRLIYKYWLWNFRSRWKYFYLWLKLFILALVISILYHIFSFVVSIVV